MDSYSKLKKLDLSPFSTEDSVVVSIQAKGLLVSNPTVAAKTITGVVKVPGGGSTITISIAVPAFSSRVLEHRVTEINGTALDTGLSIFELY